MKKIRYYFALHVAKLAQFLMKLLGRNATFLPGKIAIKLSPDFLKHLTPPKTVIAVTGTNGKTTVSNLLSSILTQNGYSITNNSFGSNVQAGVISALIEDTTIFGKPKKDIAVLEVDERSSLLIYPDLKPDYLVCNNIMRDSLKRNAHTEFIQFIISKALPLSTKLVLNADDIISSSLKKDGQACVYFGISAEKPEGNIPQHIKDIVYCPECGAILESEYVRYNHIGRHFCTACQFQSEAPDYVITEIDREKDMFTILSKDGEEKYNLINDNIVNVYNFAAAIALLKELGLDHEQIAKGFSKTKIVKTRFEEIESGNLKITMLMAKGQNPIACARCYDYVAKVPGDNKCAILVVDDKDDNINNSESTCWLYDCDYSALADPSIKQVIFCGPRCKDHLLRALLAGVDESKISITEDCSESVNLLNTDICQHIYVLHELYRPEDARTVKNGLISLGKETHHGN
ncbi:MAG: DUF1727 domain-containing protein [Oscillospiraceae bacterium]|nr:DUF1727 domain-containing protein [Oscillospiraceae bacterium]